VVKRQALADYPGTRLVGLRSLRAVRLYLNTDTYRIIVSKAGVRVKVANVGSSIWWLSGSSSAAVVSGTRCKARHEIKGKVGDTAFRRSKGVGAEVGHVAKLLLLTELLLPMMLHHTPIEGADQQTLQAGCLPCGHGLPSLETPRCRHASVHVHPIWPDSLHDDPIFLQPELAVGCVIGTMPRLLPCGVGNAVGQRQIEDFHHAAALRKDRTGLSTAATPAAETAALSKRRRSRISEGSNMRNPWSRTRLPSTRV
jgi:hypothetical protein